MIVVFDFDRVPDPPPPRLGNVLQDKSVCLRPFLLNLALFLDLNGQVLLAIAYLLLYHAPLAPLGSIRQKLERQILDLERIPRKRPRALLRRLCGFVSLARILFGRDFSSLFRIRDRSHQLAERIPNIGVEPGNRRDGDTDLLASQVDCLAATVSHFPPLPLRVLAAEQFVRLLGEDSHRAEQRLLLMSFFQDRSQVRFLESLLRGPVDFDESLCVLHVIDEGSLLEWNPVTRGKVERFEFERLRLGAVFLLALWPLGAWLNNLVGLVLEGHFKLILILVTIGAFE